MKGGQAKIPITMPCPKCGTVIEHEYAAGDWEKASAEVDDEFRHHRCRKKGTET